MIGHLLITARDLIYQVFLNRLNEILKLPALPGACQQVYWRLLSHLADFLKVLRAYA